MYKKHQQALENMTERPDEYSDVVLTGLWLFRYIRQCGIHHIWQCQDYGKGSSSALYDWLRGFSGSYNVQVRQGVQVKKS